MIDPTESPFFTERTPWEEAQQKLEAVGLGDGLPLVPPTARRMERMLAEVVEPERTYGPVPPLFGDLTAAAIAYQCVLAGCLPAELPIVLTAVAACLAPEFNLLGIQTTTGTPTVAVIVHGSAARALGVNGGSNCLGPGNRANACIGRAVRLALTNIGGARPGVGDMATMGQPGKYTFCFAECDNASLPSLPARRGFADGQGAVTVLGVSGTMEVLPLGGEATPQGALRPFAVAALGAEQASSAGRSRPASEQFLLLPPEVLDFFERARWTPADIQAGMARALAKLGVACSAEDMNPVLAGGAGIKMTYLPLWSGGTRSITAELLRP